MQTILHIGQHKTGTTSLQHFLRDNRKQLEAIGVYVATDILGHTLPSQYILSIYALAEERSSFMKDHILAVEGGGHLKWIEENLPEAIEKIYATAREKNCSRIIWSNEGLYLLNSVEEYLKLISLFEPFSTEVSAVCCFRDKESFRRSYTNELLKQKLSKVKDEDLYRYVDKDS